MIKVVINSPLIQYQMQTLHSLQIWLGDDAGGGVTAPALTATGAGDAAGDAGDAGDAAVYILN